MLEYGCNKGTMWALNGHLSFLLNASPISGEEDQTGKGGIIGALRGIEIMGWKDGRFQRSATGNWLSGG